MIKTNLTGKMNGASLQGILMDSLPLIADYGHLMMLSSDGHDMFPHRLGMTSWPMGYHCSIVTNLKDVSRSSKAI